MNTITPAGPAVPGGQNQGERAIPDAHEKALQVNLDRSTYGSLAEIGAGQEVARWFFQAGGASGTIAKTISAYDMAVSDEIYGKADRYVSRQRLQAMLDHEYGLLVQRLGASRGAEKRFFAFASTVAARSFERREGECHGWLGIRFQSKPQVEPSEIIIHVRLFDRENVQQQEALGLMGVNLIHGAFFTYARPETLIASLMDNLTRERIEVDMFKCSGPAFHGVDNRLMSLQLVQQGLTDAALFTADGEVVQAAEVLYKHPILVERGSFRPVTNVTLDMLRCAQAQFALEPGVGGGDFVVLMEMTLRNLLDGGGINHRDFLHRVDILGTMGKPVLISSFAEHFRLAAYLQGYTKQKVGFVMGVPTLREIFDEKYYAGLEGGILESFGRLFKNDLKLYVYPLQEQPGDPLTTAGNLAVAPHLRHLYAYLTENHFIQCLRDFDPACLPIFSRQVLAQIRSGDAGWEAMVPPPVAALIKERRLFNYAADGGPLRACA